MADYTQLVAEAIFRLRSDAALGYRQDQQRVDLVHAVEALTAENERLRTVARAAVRRLEKAAQFCGDPQHPRWDGGRTSTEARRRIDGLLAILDPFRPELEDATDEDWDRVYKLDPIDAYVSDYEERMEARATAAEAERDALQAQLDSMTVEKRPPRWAPDNDGYGVKIFHEQRLVGPWVEVTDHE
jgi:hypothetical protein